MQYFTHAKPFFDWFKRLPLNHDMALVFIETYQITLSGDFPTKAERTEWDIPLAVGMKHQNEPLIDRFLRTKIFFDDGVERHFFFCYERAS